MDDLVVRLRSAGCVFAEDEAAVLRASATSPEQLEELVVRRIAGEPLELVVGWASFDGLRVRVAPGVFVPRLRTTLLVSVAAQLLAGRESDPEPGLGVMPTTRMVLDLGCGTGAIGAAVAARVPGVEVWAVDVDPAAAACARLNLAADRVLLGDLYAPLPRGFRATVICANAPYVPTEAIALMPPEARDHEHRVALDGGADGLDVQRRVAAGATDHLAEGGTVLIETSRAQASRTATLLREAGLATTIHTDDEVEGTVVAGRRVIHPPPVDGPPQ